MSQSKKKYVHLPVNLAVKLKHLMDLKRKTKRFIHKTNLNSDDVDFVRRGFVIGFVGIKI